MHYLFELFSEIVPLPTPEGLYNFCVSHFVIAIVLTYVLLAIVAAVLVSSVLEIWREARRVAQFPIAKVLMATAGVTGALLSVLCIFFMLRVLEPIPAFNEDNQRDFIREPVVLQWKYGKGAPNDLIVYQYQSAPGNDFNNNIFSLSDGNSLYSYQHEDEGMRWWRVRAILDGGKHMSGWSRPLQTTFYKSAYSRVGHRKELLTYVSSFGQGIFKFLSPEGKLMGSDIEIANAVSQTLSDDMHKPIKTHYLPVSWDVLLKQPEQGYADMIISNITKLQSRESEYHIKFSEPYFCTGLSLLFRKDDYRGDVAIRDMLKDKTIGYQKGTTSEKLVDALAAELGERVVHRQPFSETESAVQSLIAPNSSIQLIVADTPFAVDVLFHYGPGGILASKPFAASDYPASVAPEERVEEYAIAVAQGEADLLDAVNRTVAKLKKDKTLEKIFEAAAAAKYPNIASDSRVQLYATACPN